MKQKIVEIGIKFASANEKWWENFSLVFTKMFMPNLTNGSKKGYVWYYSVYTGFSKILRG